MTGNQQPGGGVERMELRCAYRRCGQIGCPGGAVLGYASGATTDAHGLVCARAAADMSTRDRAQETP